MLASPSRHYKRGPDQSQPSSGSPLFSIWLAFTQRIAEPDSDGADQLLCRQAGSIRSLHSDVGGSRLRCSRYRRISGLQKLFDPPIPARNQLNLLVLKTAFSRAISISFERRIRYPSEVNGLFLRAQDASEVRISLKTKHCNAARL
ncbi:hypothetical protein [Rhizobium sp. P44RR-XXIV]|uniref:hypothetical protein n=1 Tax=Rhizobium sp. P44RR-XXIV TaxID=1921145 RepID=UPI0010AB3D6E|nr:hypothetical protein [Rhizobium sp. P44RR-XXIV]TIX90784.1 hypothetical protein BSK43_016175 [Rhizobium sp. P44RR-XXIV]